MDPITQSNMESEIKDQITRQAPLPDAGSLIYKTMPHKESGFFKPSLASAQTPAPQTPVPRATTPPAPKPVPKPVVPVPPRSTTPVGSAIPLKPVPATSAIATEHNISDDFGFHSDDLPKKKLNVKGIAIAVLILLLLIGGAVGYYLKTKKSKNTAVTNKVDNLNTAVDSKIPDVWRAKYFGAPVCADVNVCGDSADPDHDGLSNLEEFNNKTDPNNPDSDADGLSDGDEVHIFHSNPTASHTSGKDKYTDADDAKSMWFSAQGRKFTDSELDTVAQNIKIFGLHIPTSTTLGGDLVNQYTNRGATPSPTSQVPSQDPAALDRDTQRSDTVTKLSAALVKYKGTNKKYPDGDYAAMIVAIKPLIISQAVNTTDPTNKEPYTYKYQSVSAGADFKLSYFAETAGQLVVFNETIALKAANTQQIQSRDTKRKTDLEQIASALELYSTDHADATNPDQKIYPSQADWKSQLEPKYIKVVPVDPLTGRDYTYTVSGDNSSFALQVELEKAPTDKKGYLCTSESCGYY